MSFTSVGAFVSLSVCLSFIFVSLSSVYCWSVCQSALLYVCLSVCPSVGLSDCMRHPFSVGILVSLSISVSFISVCLVVGLFLFVDLCSPVLCLWVCVFHFFESDCLFMYV